MANGRPVQLPCAPLISGLYVSRGARYACCVLTSAPGEDEDMLIAVSPRHSVRLAQDYSVFVRTAPQADLVIRTIARREANGLPLMSADIVIAGKETRARFPLAETYPLHFRKTYYPARIHGDPRQEYARQADAAALLGLPAPIGATHNEFRTCLLPGRPYSQLSPFGEEPDERNIPIAERLSLPEAAGLYYLVSEAYRQLIALHAGGLVHQDAELHNLIVCSSPLEVIVIDFEAASTSDSLSEDKLKAAHKGDLHHLLREAIYLECALGAQTSPISVAAQARLDELFTQPGAFRRAIARRTIGRP